MTLAEEWQKKLDACIHCGMCLPACPTYRVTGSEAESPRGRLYLMKHWLSPGETTALAADEVSSYLDHCLACHACETACPSGVEYGNVLFEARHRLVEQDGSGSRKFRRWLFQSVLPNAGLLRLSGLMLRLYQVTGLQRFLRTLRLFRLVPGLDYLEGLLPSLKAYRPLTPGAVFGEPDGEPVVLITGCVMDTLYNHVHWDTIEVLVKNGFQVTIPQPACCGALAHHAGETDITRQQAKAVIDACQASNPRWVVLNSAGCGSSMKDYGELLAEDPEYAQPAKDFSKKVVDVLSLLTYQQPLAPMGSVYIRLAYHAACHLHHAQRVQEEPVTLLSSIPGLTLVPLADAAACCGSAGIYNVQHPQLSQKILAQKVAHVVETGADALVTANPGCLLQIESGLRRAGHAIPVRHPVEILAEAYRALP